MNKKTIEQVLQEQGFYTSTTSGVSMYPMLRDRKDIIVIRKKKTYQKYDVVLYKRNNTYLLHRIIALKDKQYIIRGDNCLAKEYDIDESKVIGYLDECYRNDRKINLKGWKYQCYVRIWHYSFPLRYLFKVIKSKLVK